MRLGHGAHVLDTETRQAGINLNKDGNILTDTAGAAISKEDAALAEVLRAIPDTIITHSKLAAVSGSYRRRPGEDDATLRERENKVLQRGADLQLGEMVPKPPNGSVGHELVKKRKPFT